jgi:hypothetical protein
MEKYKWIIGVLFSGLGTALIGWILFNNNAKKKYFQKQKAGNGSINVQAGKDITIKSDSKNE